MQLAKRFDFEDEQTLLLVRIGYVASQLICLASYYYVSIQVRTAYADVDTTHRPFPQIKRKNDLTVLKYVEPKAPLVRPSSSPLERIFTIQVSRRKNPPRWSRPRTATTTSERPPRPFEDSSSESPWSVVHSHSVVVPSLKVPRRRQMGFMHLYMKYTQPLFIQGILPLKGLYDSKILLIHLLGKPATGDLKRPFAVPAGFMSAPAPAVTADATPVAAAAAVEGKKDL